MSVEGLIDLDDTLQFIDIVVRSELSDDMALQPCVEHMRQVVATCEDVCAASVIRFEAKVIMQAPLKRDGSREVAAGVAPQPPIDVAEAGVSQPRWVVDGLFSQAETAPGEAPMLERIFDTVTENRAKLAAVHADIGLVVRQLERLKQTLSVTLKHHHTELNTRLEVLARSIAAAADATTALNDGQDAIASRVATCVDELRKVGIMITTRFDGCDDGDGTALEELARVRYALHDGVSVEETTHSDVFKLLDQRLEALQHTVERNHVALEDHLDVIVRSGTAAAMARRENKQQLASMLEVCCDQLTELYRAVSIGDVKDDERHAAIQDAMATITRAIEASSSDVQDAVTNAASGIRHFALSLSEHRVPSVFVVVPNVQSDAGGLLRRAAALLRDPVAFCKERLFGVMRVRLVCMRTWGPVSCGEDGLGYKIQRHGIKDAEGYARCLATLMRGTLVTARMYNAGASLARLFGIPAPKVPTDALEELVEAIVSGEETPEFCQQEGLSCSHEQLWGARIRQYEEWLATVDPHNKWGGLERELDDESNKVRWVLPLSTLAEVDVFKSDVVEGSSALDDGGGGDAAGAGSTAVVDVLRGTDGQEVHRGDVFVKETRVTALGHPWRSRHWRVMQNDNGGGWTVEQWRYDPDSRQSGKRQRPDVIRVPATTAGGSTEVCRNATDFMRSKRGKHVGVLELTTTTMGRVLLFKADVRRASDGDGNDDAAAAAATTPNVHPSVALAEATTASAEQWRKAFQA